MAPSLEDWVAAAREVPPVHAKRERAVHGVTLGGVAAFAKHGWAGKRRELESEAERSERLHAMGLPVPRVLAAGSVDSGHWLVTEQVPGQPLIEVLEHALETGDDALRRRALDVAANALRALHDAGVSFLDATAVHLFVGADDGRWIDLARTRLHGRPLRPSERAHDLAALLFSLPLLTASRIERVRLVRASTGTHGDDLRELWRRIDRRLRRLARRTRWRHRHAAADARLRADLTARPLFDALFAVEGWEVVRVLDDRQNRRRSTAATSYFAKVYPPTASGWSPAMDEIRAADLMQRAGIPACRVVGYAEDRELGSVSVTRQVPGAPLDDWLRSHPSVSARRDVARRVGELFGRMRRAGLRHRDAYACHVFVAPRPDGSHELHLIDLTRAGLAPFPAGRWFVKDASQLWHGLRLTPATRTDAVRFLRSYFRIRRLDREAKRFARRVLAKERRIEARQVRKRAEAQS